MRLEFEEWFSDLDTVAHLPGEGRLANTSFTVHEDNAPGGDDRCDIELELRGVLFEERFPFEVLECVQLGLMLSV